MTDTDFLARLHAGFGAPREEVVDFAERAGGSKVVGIERLTLGDENEVYRVLLASAELPVYVRIRRPDSGTFDAEVWAMERARSAGVAVPEVVALDEFRTGGTPRAAMLVAGAPGRSLSELLPTLAGDQRDAVLTDLGRTLALLHSIRTPGVARPDPDGHWPDPEAVLAEFVAERRGQRADLVSAGLTESEVARIIEVIGTSPDIPAPADPVLCHGDLHPGHAYINDRLEVCGVIDWGLWHGGSPVDDLSTMLIHYSAADFATILAGHGLDRGRDVRRRLALATINQLVGHVAWSESIGNTDGSAQGASTLRAALQQLADAD